MKYELSSKHETYPITWQDISLSPRKSSVSSVYIQAIRGALLTQCEHEIKIIPQKIIKFYYSSE
jgi:hypothetical protein